MLRMSWWSCPCALRLSLESVAELWGCIGVQLFWSYTWHVLSLIHEDQDTFSSISCCIHLIMTSSSPNAPSKSKSWVYDFIKEDYDDKNLKQCTLCEAFIKCGNNTEFSKTINFSYHLFQRHQYEAWQAKISHLQASQELDHARRQIRHLQASLRQE